MLELIKAFFNGLAQSILTVIGSYDVSGDVLGVISNAFNNFLS